MYWAIDMEPGDLNLAHTVWRQEENQPLQLYRHQKLVMGGEDSQTQAILCVQKAAELQQNNAPNALSIIKKDAYSDDINITGWTPEEVIKETKELAQTLGQYNFHIRKLVSDQVCVLQNVKL